MNNCVLMAKIIRNPELRYTQDNQRPFTQMLVEFDALRPEEAPATLRVISWGNLATEVAQNYVEGNWVILEGRLSMNRYERQEGFKETRAELVVSHIYRVEGQVIASVSASTSGVTSSATPATNTRKDNVVPMDSFKPKQTESQHFDEEFEQASTPPEMTQPARQPVTQGVSSPDDQDLDDIPFMRPVILKTQEIDLQDCWELAANRPGNWLHGFQDLF